jgi:succinoglycan biosynthesis transport protein ExoP
MSGNPTIDALRRFWYLILALAAVGALVGAVPKPDDSADSFTRWRARHTMLVSTPLQGDVVTDARLFSQLALFTTTGEVPVRVAQQIGYNGSPAALAEQINVTSEQTTGALRISTTQATAEQAVEVADTFAEQLVSFLAERQDRLIEERLTAVLERLDDLEQQLADAEGELRSDPDDRVALAKADALARQYGVVFGQFDALQSAGEGEQLILTTLESAQPIPESASGLGAPKSRTSRGALGAAVGAILGIGVAIVLARSDRRLRTREQVEDELDMVVHATIPAVSNHRSDVLAVVPDRHDPLSDSYRTLRSILSFIDINSGRPEGRGSTTLVVSAGAGDGKTSVSANLASAFVEAGGRVVAVNTDFRRPTLSRRLGVIDPEPSGLTLGEIEFAPLESLLSPVPGSSLTVFDLAPMRTHNPGDLARVTARVLPRLTADSDHVVIDSSPVAATAEVLEFVPFVDTIVMVISIGHTTIQSARRTVEKLRALSVGNIVLVLIGDDGTESSDYYRYSMHEPKQAGRIRRLRARAAAAFDGDAESGDGTLVNAGTVPTTVDPDDS